MVAKGTDATLYKGLTVSFPVQNLRKTLWSSRYAAFNQSVNLRAMPALFAQCALLQIT